MSASSTAHIDRTTSRPWCSTTCWATATRRRWPRRFRTRPATTWASATTAPRRHAYYTGQGNDPVTGWAPIMGVGYYKPLVQFSTGEYARRQQQGRRLRGDAELWPAAARRRLWQHHLHRRRLPGHAGGTVDGVIEQAGDADVFSFTAGAGSFTASVSPASRSRQRRPGADAARRLGQRAGHQQPAERARRVARATTLPAAGTYYIEVRGTGQGDPAATGYSTYGSVGNLPRVRQLSSAGGTAAQRRADRQHHHRHRTGRRHPRRQPVDRQ